jgi:hypothetical protein
MRDSAVPRGQPPAAYQRPPFRNVGPGRGEPGDSAGDSGNSGDSATIARRCARREVRSPTGATVKDALAQGCTRTKVHPPRGAPAKSAARLRDRTPRRPHFWPGILAKVLPTRRGHGVEVRVPPPFRRRRPSPWRSARTTGWEIQELVGNFKKKISFTPLEAAVQLSSGDANLAVGL